MLYVHTGSQTFNEQCTYGWFPFSEGAWSCSRINTAAGFQHRAVCLGLPPALMFIKALSVYITIICVVLIIQTSKDGG